MRRRSTPPENISRREILSRFASLGACLPFVRHPLGSLVTDGDSSISAARDRANLQTPQASSHPKDFALAASDDQLLDEISQAAFKFFWEEASPYTGLVKDRSAANNTDPRIIASTAATGFGLTALCIADKRGWLPAGKAAERVRSSLKFLLKMPHQRGFLFHFINMHTGDREFTSEISSIDTSLLLCGVLTCRGYFDGDKEIQSLATQFYERVDWTWMLDGGTQLSHGWTPESGFLKSRWDLYCELMMIYLLGLGSPTHPLPAETWNAWTRAPFEYQGIHIIGSNAPLFVHQYSHAWFDFQNKRDSYGDYFQNSVLATQIHKLFCLSLANRFPDYSEDLWGITASDSARGYVVWGGPPQMGPIDGSVVPSAAAGSLPFQPADSLRVLRNIRNNPEYQKHVWKRYGLVDAFNPLKKWYNPDVIGINLGISLLMAENLRSGFIWETFMKNEAAQRGMSRAGFRENEHT